MQQRIFKLLLILLLLAGLLAPGLGAPARVAAQDDGGPDPAAPAAVDTGTDTATDTATGAATEAGTGEVVDPASVCDDPLPAGSIPGSKEIRLQAKESTYIASGKPGNTLDGTGRLRVGYSVLDGEFAVRPLVKFDLGSIPRGAQVYSAQMELQVKLAVPPTDPNQNMGIKVSAVAAGYNWSQGNASWINSSFIGGSPSVSASVPKGGTGKVNMIDLVKYWVNGGANHGVMIIGDERPDQGRVRTMDKWPALTVVYRCDTMAPVSSMVGLNSLSPRTFTVGWGGEDKAPDGCKPSGINKFYLEYNVDSQGWQPYTEKSGGTTSHEFNRDVPNGATVQFRVYADDKAGNVQKSASKSVTTRVITKAPTVVFNQLPTWTHAASFTLSWYATDALIGVSSYDIQYQVNRDGNWKDLIVQTQQTSFTFTGGQNETVYSFRARARDSIGNEGSYPRQAGTETTVVLYPIAKVAAFNPNIIQSTTPVTKTFTVNWTGQNTPDTWIVSFQIRYQVTDFKGQVLMGWKDWKSFAGNVTSAEFPIEVGDGVYEFEATATDNLNRTTPYKGMSESSMIVDLADTFKIQGYMPAVMAP
ncbi:MAG: DNRLRE domain-containing protein [Caldilineaceae bacterium]